MAATKANDTAKQDGGNVGSTRVVLSALQSERSLREDDRHRKRNLVGRLEVAHIEDTCDIARRCGTTWTTICIVAWSRYKYL